MKEMNRKKDDKDIEKALTGLLEKYSITSPETFHLSKEDYSNAPSLLPGYFFIGSAPGKNQIPLLTWRVKRKFIELKKIVSDSVIEKVCLFRFCCMGSKDKWEISELFYRELDLFEYIGNGKIISVQAVISDNEAGNAIVRLDNGALCSIEVSIQMPGDTPLVDRHEIIAQRGVTSDLVVDTQVPQSSIYSYTRKGEKRYTDVDMELYGFDDLQVDQIRSAFQVFKDPELANQWLEQHNHLVKLVQAVFESDSKRGKINIK